MVRVGALRDLRLSRFQAAPDESAPTTRSESFKSTESGTESSQRGHRELSQPTKVAWRNGRVVQYAAAIHFLGQTIIFTLTDECATENACCLAHHVGVDGCSS